MLRQTLLRVSDKPTGKTVRQVPPVYDHLGRPDARRPGVVAHRGASGEYPELTMVAYEQALKQGAEGLECDIRLTADGLLVCIHDATTLRVSPQRRFVHASTLDELSGLDVGSWHPLHRKPEPVLPLRQLLMLAEAYPEVKLFLETKHPVPTAGLVEKALAEELRYFGIDRPATTQESRAVFMSFSVLAVRRFGQLAPRIPRVQLRERRNVAKSVPAVSMGVQMMGPSICALRSRPSLVDYWHSRGLGVYCWTVDDASDVALCQELGVDWIGTNHPGRSRRFVQTLLQTPDTIPAPGAGPVSGPTAAPTSAAAPTPALSGPGAP